METTERIVEAYVRHVLGCATLPNLRCPGQNEIDLLAIHPKTLERYHIETSVSIASGFDKLTGKLFDPDVARTRVGGPQQRRTVGFFHQRKFSPVGVLATLAEYGFEEGDYQRVIVTWGWTLDAKEQADQLGLVLWDFREIVDKIAERVGKGSGYHGDDTLRTLHLFTLAQKQSLKGKQ